MQTSQALNCSVSFITTPQKRPRPRTNSTTSLGSFLSSSIKTLPISKALSYSPSFSSTSMAVMATLQPKGLPPKVLPCSPGLIHNITSSLVRAADTGKTPPPRALPRVRMSGFTPSQSHADRLPVRPRPDCTSSAIQRTLYLVHKARTLFRYLVI